MKQLKEAKEHAEREHSKYLEELKEMAHSTRDNTAKSMLEWFKLQTEQLGRPSGAPDGGEAEKARQEQEARNKQIQELQAQQEKIAQQLAELTGGPKEPSMTTPQEVLLDQLRNTLTNKKEEDQNKLLLKALVTSQNKTTGEGGTNTLRPPLLNSLTNTDGNCMAEWLVSLNKQEEGESDMAKLILSGENDLGARARKVRSGMLDKATTNIQQKQIWPQQNLGEDWADETQRV